MTIALFDVNVLIAIADSTHILSMAAENWLARNRGTSWASCPLTQAGFARLVAQPTGPVRIPVAQAMEIVDGWRSSPSHQFWPHETPLSDLLPEIRSRIRGPKQITDAILLDLAIRKGGRLVTFDAKVRSLLPDDSPHQAAIEVIPA